jgi:hypothetical protein
LKPLIINLDKWYFQLQSLEADSLYTEHKESHQYFDYNSAGRHLCGQPSSSSSKKTLLCDQKIKEKVTDLVHFAGVPPYQRKKSFSKTPKLVCPTQSLANRKSHQQKNMKH